MADGLSIAASIAGLISIADIIVRRGFKYAKAVKDADKSVKALIEEVNSLSGILHSLKNVAETLQDDQVAFEPATQIHYVEDSYQTLQKVQKLLDEADPVAGEGRIDSTKRKLKWPIAGSRVKELLSEVERHKATMTLAISADEMSALILLLARQSSLQEVVTAVERGLESDRAKRHQTQINEKTKQVFQFLGSINAQGWQDTNIRLRQPGTGIWFTDGPCFGNWLVEKNSKLWVYGIPGAGKTVLISSVIQETQRQLRNFEGLAFFYCDYKNSATHQPLNILGALAKQFATQDERCFSCLEALYQTHKLKDQSTKAPTVDELCELLQQMTSFFNSAMIIVDGLDEISQNRAEVAAILTSLNKPGSTIKTLFSSRREFDLEHPLREYVSISIAAMSSDLRLYVGSEVVKREESKRLRIQDPSLKETIVETLINGADGMFRWVACQMDYLCECTSDRDRREALKKLPPDLPSSYERILERVNKSSRANQTFVTRVLAWLVYCRESLSAAALLQAVAVDEEQKDFDLHAVSTEDDLFHWCSSLIRREPSHSGGTPIELAHFTVKEYLLSLRSGEKPSLAKYYLNKDEADILLGRTCLTFLNFKTFQQVTLPRSQRKMLEVQLSLLDDYKFLPIATECWDNFVSRQANNPTIRGLVRTFFCPTPCRQFKLWRSLKRYYDCLPTGDQDDTLLGEVSNITPLHWAAVFGLEIMVKELLQHGVDANQGSSIGTPLGCGILSYTALYTTFEDLIESIDLNETCVRARIVRSLLAAGADPMEKARPESTRSLLSLAIELEHYVEPRMCLALMKGNAPLHYSDVSALRERVDIFGDDEESSKEFAHAVYEAALLQSNDKAMREEIFMLAMHAPVDVAKASRLRALSFRGTMSADTYKNLLEWLTATVESFLYDEEFEDHETFELCLKALRTCSPRPTPVLEDIRQLILGAIEAEADEDILTALLEDSAVLSCTDDNGNTLLHSILFRHEHWKSTQESPEDDDDGDALSHSIGSADSIRNPSEDSVRDDQSLSSRHVGLLRRVEIFLDNGANVTAQNKKGETPLHLATKIPNVELFRLIYDAAPSEVVLKKMTGDGQTLLLNAIDGGCKAIIDFLAEECDSFSGDAESDSMLKAAKSKKWNDVQSLIEAGVDTSSVMERTSHVIHYAAKAGEETIVRLLLEKSSNKIVDMRDEEGATPLLLSARTSENASTFRLLLKHGADPKATSNIGSIAEYAVCAAGNDIRKLLLPLRIDWNYRTECVNLPGGSVQGCPIHKAAYEGRLEVIEFLLMHNLTDPDIDIGNGFTPLNLATRGGHIQVVRLLLENGAAINSVDRTGQNPLYLAMKGGAAEIIEAMIEFGRDKDIIDAILRMPDGRGTIVRWLLKEKSPPPPPGAQW